MKRRIVSCYSSRVNGRASTLRTEVRYIIVRVITFRHSKKVSDRRNLGCVPEMENYLNSKCKLEARPIVLPRRRLAFWRLSLSLYEKSAVIAALVTVPADAA